MAEKDIYLIVAVAVMAIAMMSGILIYMRRYVRVPPNKALILYGGRRDVAMRGPDGKVPRAQPSFRIITGGGIFIPPIIKEYGYLLLDAIPLDMKIERVASKESSGEARFRLTAAAIIRIENDEASLISAAKTLLNKTVDEILKVAQPMVEGHIRTACAHYDPNEMHLDRDRIANEARQMANDDLAPIGLVVDAIVIKEIERRVEAPEENRSSVEEARKISELLGTINDLKRRISELEQRLKSR